MAYNYGKSFKKNGISGNVCYRYTNKNKSTKTLVYVSSKKSVPKSKR